MRTQLETRLRILTGTHRTWPVPDGFTGAELDIGCGKGGFVAALATRYPDRLVIGADVMLGRLRKADKRMVRQALGNTELLRCAAWDLLALHLPDGFLDLGARESRALIKESASKRRRDSAS